MLEKCCFPNITSHFQLGDLGERWAVPAGPGGARKNFGVFCAKSASLWLIFSVRNFRFYAAKCMVGSCNAWNEAWTGIRWETPFQNYCSENLWNAIGRVFGRSGGARKMLAHWSVVLGLFLHLVEDEGSMAEWPPRIRYWSETYQMLRCWMCGCMVGSCSARNLKLELQRADRLPSQISRTL